MSLTFAMVDWAVAHATRACSCSRRDNESACGVRACVLACVQPCAVAAAGPGSERVRRGIMANGSTCHSLKVRGRAASCGRRATC